MGDNYSIKKNMSCLTRIKTLYDNSSGTIKKIASKIIDDPEKLVHMTIVEMARYTDTSEASIVRFYKTLGYSGFNEMKIYIASELELSNAEIHENIQENDKAGDILKKVFNAEIQAIQSTLRSVDIKEFEKAVDCIANAQKVEFYAYGNTRNIAYDANYRFLRIGIPSFVAVDFSNSLIQANMLTPRDVAIGISHSGSTRHTVEALQLAQNRGAVTIAITGYTDSPITKAADISLISETQEKMFRDVGMSARTAQVCLIDAIYVSAAFMRLSESKNYLKITDKFMAEEKY